MLSAKSITRYRLILFLHYLLKLSYNYVTDAQSLPTAHGPDRGPRRELVCPLPNYRPDSAEKLLLNLLPCASSQDCPLHQELGILCCKVEDGKHRRCRYGVIPPKPKPTHLPLLGVERHCPEKDALAEILPVKNCTGDNDCWPRICCDGFCRTPDLEKIIPNSGYTSLMSLKSAAEYFQCTPPPRFDFFKKSCQSLRDCLPLVCCQEKDMKVCRPGKKSILPLLATLVKETAEG